MRKYLSMIALVCLVNTGRAQDKQPSINVSGEVAKMLTLQAGDLAKMKRVTVSMKDKDGKDHAYTGVPVLDVLNMAGVPTGKQLRGENLTKFMLVKAGDGYEVVFSLAELDADFTDRIVIIADEMDGKPLPAGRGPFRLVVPGEKKPARCVLQVTELVIKQGA